MKKYVIATAVAAAAFAPAAFAQAKNFEGFSVYAGLNVASSTYEWTGTSPVSLTSTATNVGLQAQYSFALGDTFVLGLGASAGLGDLLYGTVNGVDIKLKNSVSAYVAPGFAISNSALIYGKVASLSATSSGTNSMDNSGIGYGLGAQILSGKNVYYQVEYMQNNYDDKNTSTGTNKFKSGALSFGVGYKF